MPTNQFYEFATSSAAYVESLPDYLADVERTAGQQSGIARAELNNRALRQGSAMAAAIGSFMSAQGYDALDDGDTATRASDFALAVAALIQPNIASAVNAAKTDVLQRVFPVGSFYTSYNVNTNPGTLLGFGTWAAVQGRFLLSASSAYPAASTGGAATHTITVGELPAHSHSASTGSAGAHTHTASTASAGAHTHSVSGTAASAGEHTHTVTAASDGSHTHTVSGTAASAGAHTHTGTAAKAGEHTHTASAATAGAHTHTATTSTGGAHTHTRGTMNITGSIIASDTDGEILIAPDKLSQSGALYVSDKVDRQGPFSSGGGTAYQGLNFDASRSWTGNTNSTGGHTHTLTTNSAGSHTHTITVADAGAHTHTVSVTSAGAHTHSVSGTAASAGAHTHAVTAATAGAHTHAVSATAASAGGHTHTVTVASAGTHSHTVTVGSTGSGSAMSLLPPYMAVYMWRRTA